MAKSKDADASVPSAESKDDDKKKKKIDPTAALMTEIEEDLRQDELKRLWQTYGQYLVVAGVLLVLVVAGFQYYQAQQLEARIASASQFEDAIGLSEDGNFEDAAALFASIAETAPNGFSTLAALRNADLLIEQGKTTEALDVYASVFEDPSVDRLFQDTAVVLYVTHAIGVEPAGDLEALIAPLTNPSNPLSYSALELTGILAMEQNDAEQARDVFSGLLADNGTPQAMRARVGELLESLGPVASDGGAS